ncbi:MAG: bifunctional phosphopantothenoylcysteine decarboxylase/phosphopantothenate--cysteine ligase CoaBC [Burkholderiales bacterium]|nr:bifunctional phosphopantothenoylcysteine decarboxylase/phosphopantothenate--cysteine ligase CoaBC [Burkholderiales bacterium]
MKNILIGISGSIAAYKTTLLIRELSKLDYNIKVVITRGGQTFVTKELMAGLGIEIYTDQSIDLSDHNQAMLHINLAKWSDLIMIAPASANFIAKIANGMADNLLLEIILAANKKPIYIAPAMNYQMYQNIATQININKLVRFGFQICLPNSGEQACGDTGFGRMKEADELLRIITDHFQNTNITNLTGKTIMITLGATIEPIDPVRFISNNSSGKMGIALINAALETGAKVIAIYGKVSVALPNNKNLRKFKALAAHEMLDSVLLNISCVDIFISCAAICDYKVKEASINKIKKPTNDDAILLELVKNPDIITKVKKQHENLLCVGFAAETENLIENANKKLREKNLDVIIANKVGYNKVFGEDNNEIHIISKKQDIVHNYNNTKNNVAKYIFKFLEGYYET